MLELMRVLGAKIQSSEPLKLLTENKRVRSWLYLFPAFLLLGVILGYPIVKIVKLSLSRTSMGKEVFVGLTNFKFLFQDNIFWTALKNNLMLFLAVPIIISVALLIASILYDKIKGWKIYRGIVFIPYIIAIPVTGIIFGYLLNPISGSLNLFFRAVHLDFLALNWLGNPDTALFSIMGVIIWHEFGFGVLLYMARLMSVNVELYEAAEMDGAGWWQKFFHITVPQLRSIIEFHTVLLIITMLGWVFNYVYVMTAGGPGVSTYVSELYIYLNQFKFNATGIAAGASLVLFAMAIVLVTITGKLTGGWRIEYE